MGSICIKVAKRIAADRHSLKELVERAAQDEHLRGLAEKHSELNYIVLYDALDRGLRVRLHRFTEGMEDIPHNHRFNFSSAILKGSYVHTIYETTPPKEDGDDRVTWTLDQPEGSHPGAELQDQKELSLRTLISGVQIAGSSYSMYHNTIHKVAIGFRPARPRPPAQGRRCNARPSRADVDPSCVLEPESEPSSPSAPLSRR